MYYLLQPVTLIEIGQQQLFNQTTPDDYFGPVICCVCKTSQVNLGNLLVYLLKVILITLLVSMSEEDSNHLTFDMYVGKHKRYEILAMRKM